MIELLERHGLSTRKALGQHFLADPNLIRKMVAVAGVGPGDRVIEIGVGTGALTLALAATGAVVVGVEVDERLRPLHREVFAGLPNVTIRYEDATRLSPEALVGEGRWTMVANLPYNVGTGILLDVLRGVPRITRMVLMLQTEVVERLVAAPGSKIYGLPSVVAQLHARLRLAFRVPPQVFIPPPRVSSAVVVADRVPAPTRVDEAIELAAAAFRGRRKMIRSSIGLPPEVFEKAGIDPSRRAEQLAPLDYVRLAEAVHA